MEIQPHHFLLLVGLKLREDLAEIGEGLCDKVLVDGVPLTSSAASARPVTRLPECSLI